MVSLTTAALLLSARGCEAAALLEEDETLDEDALDEEALKRRYGSV